MKLFILLITLLSGLHIYLAFPNVNALLTWQFLALIFSPFIFLILQDMAKFKVSTDGFEFERINKSVSKAMRGKTLNSEELESIFDSVKNNEWATLILSRMLMRKILLSIAPSDKNYGTAPSLEELIKDCKNCKRISDVDSTDLDKLRDITFFAEWWTVGEPTHSDWNWALENCVKIVKSLFDTQIKLENDKNHS
jgi:hypothetical protein